jgi:hypothetical protein
VRESGHPRWNESMKNGMHHILPHYQHLIIGG